nr:DUF6318 family protein [Arthrobacter yangruifuii]
MLFLSACSEAAGDPGPAESPTGVASSPTATPTPTPTPTPSATYRPASAEGPAENVPLPVMPEEAKVQSKEGLEAFARYWYDLINYGFETGDVEPIKAISGPECVVCDTFYRTVDYGFDEAGWILGGSIKVEDAFSEYILTSDGRYQVLVQQTQIPTSYYGPTGITASADGTTEPAVQMMEARYTSAGWYAEDVVTIWS